MGEVGVAGGGEGEESMVTGLETVVLSEDSFLWKVKAGTSFRTFFLGGVEGEDEGVRKYSETTISFLEPLPLGLGES